MILTHTKKFINLLDFKKEDFSIEDVSFSLSNIVRYNGHTKHRYSVSKHCCNVASIVRAVGGNIPTIFYGLMHDATEAYIGDMPGPLKKKFPEFEKLEDEIMETILSTYNEVFDNPEWTKSIDFDLVKLIDKSILLPEINALMGNMPLLMNLGPVYTIPSNLIGVGVTTSEQDKANFDSWYNKYVDQCIQFFAKSKIEDEELIL
jgi:hypothetical protein